MKAGERQDNHMGDFGVGTAQKIFSLVRDDEEASGVYIVLRKCRR